MSKKNPPYAEKTSGPSYGLPNYSYVLGNAGNKKGTASGDVYYIAVNSKGGLYGGAQVNNATDITWKETATKDDLKTVAESIAQPSSDYFDFTGWGIFAERSGNTVTISFNISGTMKPVSDFILLATLGEKYRPRRQHFQAYTTQTGKPMTVKIDPNGQIGLFNNNIEVSGFFLRQTISYPAE